MVVGKEVGAHNTGVTEGFWAESIKVNNTCPLTLLGIYPPRTSFMDVKEADIKMLLLSWGDKKAVKVLY